MQNNNNQSKALGLLLFLVTPILSLFIVIKNYKSVWAKNLVWAFIVFYAYHFVAPNEGADILGYINRFENYALLDFDVRTFIISLYAEGSRTLDVLEPLLSYLLSKFTSNHKILLLSYGVIYGYFYSRNIWYFLDQLKGKLKTQTIVVLLLFLVTIGIWNLNGFRFWCATHIFIYGAYNFLILKKNKSYFFLVLSVLTHIGLLLPVLAVFLFRFIKKTPITILFILYLITLFFAELNLESVRNAITNYSPEFVKGKLESYTSEVYVEVVDQKYQGYSLFFHLSKYFRTLVLLLFAIILYLNRKSLKTSNLFYIFGFYLFLGIIANYMSQLPSGGRYLVISDFLLYGIFLCFIQNTSRFRLQRLLMVILPIILLLAIYSFRVIGINTFSIHHFINNPIVSLFIY